MDIVDPDVALAAMLKEALDDNLTEQMIWVNNIRYHVVISILFNMITMYTFCTMACLLPSISFFVLFCNKFIWIIQFSFNLVWLDIVRQY